MFHQYMIDKTKWIQADIIIFNLLMLVDSITMIGHSAPCHQGLSAIDLKLFPGSCDPVLEYSLCLLFFSRNSIRVKNQSESSLKDKHSP